MGEKKNHFGIWNVLFLIALIAVSVSIAGNVSDIITAFTEYRKSEAVITNTFDFAGARRSLTGVVVKYPVDDKYYKANIRYYKSSWKKGMKIDVYYNPDNVTEVVSIDDKIHSIFLESPFEIMLIWGTFFYDYYEDNLRCKINRKKSRLYLALANRKAKR